MTWLLILLLILLILADLGLCFHLIHLIQRAKQLCTESRKLHDQANNLLAEAAEIRDEALDSNDPYEELRRRTAQPKPQPTIVSPERIARERETMMTPNYIIPGPTFYRQLLDSHEELRRRLVNYIEATAPIQMAWTDPNNIARIRAVQAEWPGLADLLDTLAIHGLRGPDEITGVTQNPEGGPTPE